jgi:hypothetical protein
MKTDELDRLIHACVEGGLTADDAARLSALLEQSAGARARYWEMASVHGMLEDALQQAALRAVTGEASPERARAAGGRGWCPWTAAAAGLACGFLGASIAWACAAPGRVPPVWRMVANLAEGFESGDISPPRGFPRVANEWSGDLSAPVTAEAGVAPAEGTRMASLVPPHTRKYSYAWRMVDLSELPPRSDGETRRLEVSAAYLAPGPARPLRYQIRLAAFSQEPAAIRPIWNNEPALFDTVLQHVGRNVHAGAEARGWQTVRAIMDIPPGARSLVISLGASEGDPAHAPKSCYLDDVRVRIVAAKTPDE